MALIIHGSHLEVTVVGCNMFSESHDLVPRSHPLYVCFLHGGNTYITMPSQNVGMNPTFPNKFNFELTTEGQSELKFVVWKNIHTNFHYDDFMGSGRVQLHDISSKGSEVSSCPFQKGDNRDTIGEIKVVLQCTHAPSKKNDENLEPRSYPQIPYSPHTLSIEPTLLYYFHHSQHPPSHYPPTYPLSPSPYHYLSQYPPPTNTSPTPPPSSYPQPNIPQPPSYPSPPSHYPPPPPPPPPPSHYPPSSYPPPPSHYPPSSYPPPPFHYPPPFYQLPPSHYPSPFYHPPWPTYYYWSQYPPPTNNSQQSPNIPPTTINPLSAVASLASIGASLFQFFGE